MEKIKELESTLADRSEILKNMETQIAQIENEMRRLGRLMEVDNKELGKLVNKIDVFQMKNHF